MTLHVTIDRNLIIAVHKDEPERGAMAEVFAAHNNGLISVGISAANRVENQLGGGAIQSLDDLLGDCKAAGLASPHVIDFPMDWDMGLWEHGIISNEAYDLELSIHAILHPTVPTDRSVDQSKAERRRVTNRKCDVFAMWGHIWFQRDIFLTKDQRFFKRQSRLEAIGAKGIYHPSEFIKSHVFTVGA